mmetsp:Transcript_7331/g.10305  ORF Transcript_7331/g.10305 Transcript_7331/m.10305 type:complete len:548 (+) Transcript_7331:1031-2674(+)
MKNMSDQQKRICSLRNDIDLEKKKLRNYTSEVASWNPEEQRVRLENIRKRTRINSELLRKFIERQSSISTALQHVEREDMMNLKELMKLIESEDLRQRKGVKDFISSTLAENAKLSKQVKETSGKHASANRMARSLEQTNLENITKSESHEHHTLDADIERDTNKAKKSLQMLSSPVLGLQEHELEVELNRLKTQIKDNNFIKMEIDFKKNIEGKQISHMRELVNVDSQIREKEEMLKRLKGSVSTKDEKIQQMCCEAKDLARADDTETTKSTRKVGNKRSSKLESRVLARRKSTRTNVKHSSSSLKLEATENELRSFKKDCPTSNINVRSKRSKSTFKKDCKSLRKSTRIAAKVTYQRKSRSRPRRSTQKKSCVEKFAKNETVSSSEVKSRRVTRSKTKRQFKLPGSTPRTNADMFSFIVAKDTRRACKLSKKYSKRHKSSTQGSSSLNDLEGLKSKQRIRKSRSFQGKLKTCETEKNKTSSPPSKMRAHSKDNGSINQLKRRQLQNSNRTHTTKAPNSEVESSSQGDLCNSMWLFDDEDPFSFRE